MNKIMVFAVVVIIFVVLLPIGRCSGEQPYFNADSFIPEDLAYVLAFPENETVEYSTAEFIYNAVTGMGKEIFRYGEHDDNTINTKDICIAGTVDTCDYIEQFLADMSVGIGPENLSLGDNDYKFSNYIFVTRVTLENKIKILVVGSDYQSLLQFSASQLSNSTVFPREGMYYVYTPLGEILYSGRVVSKEGEYKIISAATSEQVEKTLEDKLVLMEGDELLELVSLIEDKEIVFLGETHGIGVLHNAAANLAIGLSRSRPVVYASESCYGLSPFYEQASLYNCGDDLSNYRELLKEVTVPSQIGKYNSCQDQSQRIMMTTLDVEHSIYHSKGDTTKYLQEIASRSSSKEVSEKLNSHISTLAGTTNYEEVDKYLAKLEELFVECNDCYSEQDKEEIRFALELFDASNRYQNGWRGNIHIEEDPKEIRYKYFNKTIGRAYDKAKRRNGLLLCRVGSAHICLDRKSEGKHYAREVSETTGKTISINMVYLQGDMQEADNNVLNSAVYDKMDDRRYSYLPLTDSEECIRTAFDCYTSSGQMYDGLLFVKQNQKQ